ncbi:MAG: hypothetical protein MUC89_20720 [Acetobacteraceae bacterium]|jgi:hypothetical protein|nr:hypothetical protein [Acetobacteraceae bacterium]
MTHATLWFDQAVEGGATVWRVTLEGAAGPLGPRASFSYAALDEASIPSPPVLDSLAGAALLYLQSHGQDLAVRGPMSRLALYNLGQLAEARRCTSSALYPRAAAIRPDSIRDEVPPAREPDAASLSFSGGLDSTFTAMRLGRGRAGPGAPRLGQLVITQGFDTRLDRPHEIARMVERVRPLARDAGVPLRVVRTDAWSIGGALWPQTATPLMAASLAMFAHIFPTGIIGGGLPYGTGRVGLGHPALFDQFSTGAAFRMMTDATGWTRSQKLRWLLDYPETLPNLRVCVSGFEAGGDSSSNCGRCSKCLDLWMTYRMVGVSNPPGFDREVEPALIRTLHADDVYDARGIGTLHEDAVATGAKGAWVDDLSWRLAQVPPSLSIPRVIGRAVRRFAPPSVRAAIRRRLPLALRP